jgi:hypothetical protein
MSVVYYFEFPRTGEVQFYEKRENGMYYPIGRYTNRKAQFVYLDCEKKRLPCVG